MFEHRKLNTLSQQSRQCAGGLDGVKEGMNQQSMNEILKKFVEKPRKLNNYRPPNYPSRECLDE